MAKFFLDFGYTRREELRFPAKKLRAFWFAPPNYDNGSYFGGPLPRIFISELLLDELSPRSQVRITRMIFHAVLRNMEMVLHSFVLVFK